MMNGLSWKAWRHGRLREAFSSSVRFVFGFAGIMAVCWLMDWPNAITPLLLGVIASALSETDDSWRGRLLAQTIALCCFALMIFAVRLSLAHPASLMLVLAGAAFLLPLLGAVGDRYRAIASATLIMSLYAAMAIDAPASRPIMRGQEILLLSGAAWYGVISIAWSATFPKQPVDQNLARLFDALGTYLNLKSRLLEPVRGIDLEQLRLALAMHNGRVVDALNAAKESLVSRMNPTHAPEWLQAALHRYFIAQDLHERTSSSHEQYALLADAFFHSDVLYRCQRVLALLGNDCLAIAESIRTQENWSPNMATKRAIDDMEAAIARVEAPNAAICNKIDGEISDEGRARSKRALRALASNLGAMAEDISGLFQQGRPRPQSDTTLQDRQPRKLSDFRKRLCAQMSWRAPLMRHAIRLSIAVTAGFTLMLITGDTHGYWILLTIVFVCQPQYGATLTRLMERIGGTVLGLVIGWAILRLFPDELTQAALTVVAGVLFFMTRTTRYTWATAGITMLVLLSFNQVGDGYGLIVPRLLDTLAGSLIAGISVWLVLPSWHSRRLHQLAAETLRTQAQYLREVVAQYGGPGKQDNLPYRIARRDAHNADAALSGALTAASKEPGYVRRNVGAGTRFLVLSHTLLNYLSAMGAHRNADLKAADDVIVAAHCLQTVLEELAASLKTRLAMSATERPEELAALRGLMVHNENEAEFHRVLRAQLILALHLLPSLRATANELLRASRPRGGIQSHK
ncbi:YccS family putative transporter [Propionivibrio limicola]|uniref:YccS family putative transporter n=1 Tax=Propionivibrio limicola TaxID=167645 RepID=UPI0014789A47|nr:YccS family putative transporter [Propionivibrio limicola]